MSLGLETLVQDVGGLPCDVDIVAVHGLEEDRTEAWTCPNTRTLWLKDLLPLEFPRARILTFGYKADTSSFFGTGASDNILRLAHTLIAELEASRELGDAVKRPIIFVCHGLGGVLVKRALAYSASRTSKKVEHLYSIFISTYGILFFGTPHNGMEKAGWSLLYARSEVPISMKQSSEALTNITDQFTPLTKQFHIYFFWEMLETCSGLHKGFVVAENSAAPILDDTERSGIYSTHSQLCKFDNVDCSGYRPVLAALLRYAKDCLATIETRWKEAEKFLAAQRMNEASELVGFDIRNNSKPYVFRAQSKSGMQNKYFLIPHTVSNIYTGRDDFTRGLQGKMSSFDDGTRQQRSFYGIFWVDASSIENAERAFSELGRLGGLGDTCANGMYWLTGLEMPWLLVIDNADDPSVDYSRFFPAGDRGHILITSRNQECRMLATVGYYEFKDMEQEDAVTLLLKAACVSDVTNQKVRNLAKPIARTLGNLPLALIQAGAAIRQNICSLEDYLDLYSSHRKQIFKSLPVQGSDQYKYTIFTTWEVSFRMIENQTKKRDTEEEAADAIEVLHIFAFLHFEHVPASIFSRAWKNLQHGSQPATFSLPLSQALSWPGLRYLLAYVSGRNTSNSLAESEPTLPRLLLGQDKQWDGFRLRRALALLTNFSLIYKDSDKDSYSMHPMVHFWARDRLKRNEQQLWSTIAMTTLAQSISDRGWRSDHLFRRSLASHIDACLHGIHTEPLLYNHTNAAAIAKASKFAAIYSECGRWKEASELQRQVLHQQRNMLGVEHVKTLQAMTDLASSYWNLGAPVKSLKLQLEVMNIGLRVLGPEDPITLKAMDDLASTQWLCGQLAEAEELGLKAVIGMNKVLGPGHPHTLTAMHHLGRTYMHRGRPEDAAKLQKEVLEARKKMLGATDLDTLMTFQGLGMSYNALGRFKEAEEILWTVTETRKCILGEEHAYTLWAINDLSKIYCGQGRLNEAEELLVSILDVVERTLGKEHIGMLMTKGNLALAYIGQNRWDDANVLEAELVEILERVMGPDHPDTLLALSQLARTYKHLGRLETAEKIYVEVIPKMKLKLGAENPQTLKAIIQLAAIYQGLRRFGEADELKSDVKQAAQETGKSGIVHAKTF
ncbi:hypothetical protein MMC13_008062 [Lambiella insularis]|nr:hypothetical protein [Lambiella insularis]